MSSRLGHDPALDGLRALAVTSVLLYHGAVSWLPGGFLGVDLFFVVSGYLITTLLLREYREAGRIDVAAFWVRRIRRLLPALAVMLLWVIVFATFVDDSDGEAGVRGDVVATLLHSANWYDIVSADSYFALFSSPSPLVHTWSLSIEEQWYLLWPLLLAAWVRWGRGDQRVAVVVSGAAMVASAVAMAVLVDPADPSRVYYGTDTRAQTLLGGALLAFVGAHLESTGRPLASRRVASVAGVVGLVAFVGLTTQASGGDLWMYRGGFLLATFAGIALVLSVRAAGDEPLALWVLGTRPLVFVGKRSYGLYLWHWPLFVLLTPDRTDLSGTPLLVARLAVTGAVACASYEIVEQPLRHLGRPSKSAVAGVGAATIGALVAVTLLAVPTGGLDRPDRVRIGVAAPAAPEEPDESIEPSVTIEPTPTPVPSASPASPPDPAVPLATPIVAATPERQYAPVVEPGQVIRTLVVGDSVYLDLILNFDKARHGGEVELSADVRLGCGTVRTIAAATCDDRLESWAASVDEYRPDIVLLGLSKWDVFDAFVAGQRLEFGSPAHTRNVLESLDANVELLSAGGARVVVLGVPCMRYVSSNLGTLVSERELRERTDPERRMALNAIVQEWVASSSYDVAFVDVGDLTCPDDAYKRTLDGIRLHRDGIHYTDEAIPLVWDWLVQQVSRYARGE